MWPRLITLLQEAGNVFSTPVRILRKEPQGSNYKFYHAAKIETAAAAGTADSMIHVRDAANVVLSLNRGGTYSPVALASEVTAVSAVINRVGWTASSSTTGWAIAAADFANKDIIIARGSASGAQALAIPGAATVGASATNPKVLVVSMGTSQVLTITPGAGTIAGGATFTALDAAEDFCVFVSINGTDWLRAFSDIA